MPHTGFRKDDKWVLIPGTLCTNRVFEPLLEALGVPDSHRHFVTADAPDVRDYSARLASLLTGGEILCGFSLGALILAHNLKALEKAKAVVLLATNPFADPPGNRAMREEARDRVLAGEVRTMIAENWSAMSTAPPGDLQDLVISMAEDCAPLITAQTELAASRPGASDQLAITNLPLVFVTGGEDQMTPADPIQEIAAKAPSAHLSVLDGLGHFALLEAPERVAAAICEGLSAVASSKVVGETQE